MIKLSVNYNASNNNQYNNNKAPDTTFLNTDFDILVIILMNGKNSRVLLERWLRG